MLLELFPFKFLHINLYFFHRKPLRKTPLKMLILYKYMLKFSMDKLQKTCIFNKKKSYNYDHFPKFFTYELTFFSREGTLKIHYYKCLFCVCLW